MVRIKHTTELTLAELTLQKERLQSQITDLNKELLRVERRINEIRAHQWADKNKTKITKKNQMEAIHWAMIENVLTHQHRPHKTKQIYEIIFTHNPSLNYNTFRSYLHKFKERSLLRQDKNGGWHLSG